MKEVTAEFNQIKLNNEMTINGRTYVIVETSIREGGYKRVTGLEKEEYLRSLQFPYEQ
ncbi:hypothetical protein [Bacillus velezensis]|uniref:hypothetical protein n=1 Tax=Bacillus velezensis TaxID=492670 RepID=UPI00288AB1F3|nr:hypothetical protein [Bacillus velezensis]WNJ14805.1 hypothetical protein RJY17_06100 [Bacillus velezensis]